MSLAVSASALQQPEMRVFAHPRTGHMRVVTIHPEKDFVRVETIQRWWDKMEGLLTNVGWASADVVKMYTVPVGMNYINMLLRSGYVEGIPEYDKDVIKWTIPATRGRTQGMFGINPLKHLKEIFGDNDSPWVKWE